MVPIMVAVEAEQLVKTFESRAETVEAVRGVDLRVTSGEIFGFLGPNGAGKSTTVRMLTTLTTITSGRARVAGVDVTADPDETRRRIGVALQEAGLDPRQTGRELLTLQARLCSAARDRRLWSVPASCSSSSTWLTRETVSSRATRAG